MVRPLSRVSRFAPGQAAAFVAVLALVALGSPREAAALGGEVGAFGGPALRTGTELGDTFGIYAGISVAKEIPLHIEVYYQHSGLRLDRETDAGHERKARLDIIGGRVRYLFTVLGRLHPYPTVGAGYAYARYPGVLTPQSTDLSNGPGVSIVSRTGSFAEFPLGAGLAIDAGKHIRVNVEALIRPAVGFGGAAYETGALPSEEKLRLGGSLTGGLSLWFLGPPSAGLGRFPCLPSGSPLGGPDDRPSDASYAAALPPLRDDAAGCHRVAEPRTRRARACFRRCFGGAGEAGDGETALPARSGTAGLGGGPGDEAESRQHRLSAGYRLWPAAPPPSLVLAARLGSLSGCLPRHRCAPRLARNGRDSHRGRSGARHLRGRVCPPHLVPPRAPPPHGALRGGLDQDRRPPSRARSAAGRERAQPRGRAVGDAHRRQHLLGHHSPLDVRRLRFHVFARVFANRRHVSG